MRFDAPFAFLLLGLLPIIVVMYLLKLRREEQLVSSVYLWQRMVREMEANAPWQRLRRNLLLFLQLLFTLLIILVLARPIIPADGPAGKSIAIVMDISASMGAADSVPDRLEAAKRQASQMVSDLGDGAEITVIAAGQRARVLIPSSQDRRQVINAIENLSVEMGSSDMASALQLASAVVARREEAEILLFSDGKNPLPERLAVQAPVQYFPIGVSGNNQGISLLNLELSAASETLTAFVQVSNYADEPASRRLSLFADGSLFNAYDLEMDAYDQQAVIAADLPLSTQVVEARLEGEDVLNSDNQAWAVYQPVGSVQVLLVSDGSRFLETALSLLPGIETTRIAPADYFQSVQNQANGSASNVPDLTILDNVVLTDTLSITQLPGDLFILGPLASSEYFNVSGLVNFPELRTVLPGDARIQDISFELVSVFRAAYIPVPTWATSLVEGKGQTADGLADTSILFAGTVDGRQVAVLTFPLGQSDLPLQVAFPLLLSNMLNWFVPDQGSPFPAQVQPLTPVEISVLQGSQSVEVFTPSGKRTRMEFGEGPTIFSDTSQPGIYQVRWSGGQESAFAVNMFLAGESDVAPVGSLAITGSNRAGGENPATTGWREWWRPLAYLALAILMFEWMVYHRGVLLGWYRRYRLQRTS